jgi:heme/copper-type cytochrome/quinol oxidase subunit 2
MKNNSRKSLCELEDYEITNEDYLDLWKYFQDRADGLKDKLWTIATWLLLLILGILGYIVKNFLGSKPNEALITNAPLSIIFSVFALSICFYVLLIIKDYGRHIGTNWDRASILRRKIKHFDEIWYLREKEKKDGELIKSTSRTDPCKHLFWITIAIIVIFLVIIVLSLSNLIK